MPIGKYLECMAVADIPDINERNTALLSILTDTPEDELLMLSLSEFGGLMKKAGFLVEQPEPDKVANRYTLSCGEMIPCKDIRKMTAGQFIDYQELSKAEGEHIVEILSCFLVPKGHRYNDDEYDIDAVRDAIRNELPITFALGLSAFFLTSFYRWLRVFQIYSDIQLRRMKKQERAKWTETERTLKEQMDSLTNGVGSLAWMQSLKLPERLGRM